MLTSKFDRFAYFTQAKGSEWSVTRDFSVVQTADLQTADWRLIISLAGKASRKKKNKCTFYVFGNIDFPSFYHFGSFPSSVLFLSPGTCWLWQDLNIWRTVWDIWDAYFWIQGLESLNGCFEENRTMKTTVRLRLPTGLKESLDIKAHWPLTLIRGWGWCAVLSKPQLGCCDWRRPRLRSPNKCRMPAENPNVWDVSEDWP